MNEWISAPRLRFWRAIEINYIPHNLYTKFTLLHFISLKNYNQYTVYYFINQDTSFPGLSPPMFLIKYVQNAHLTALILLRKAQTYHRKRAVVAIRNFTFVSSTNAEFTDWHSYLTLAIKKKEHPSRLNKDITVMTSKRHFWKTKMYCFLQA